VRLSGKGLEGDGAAAFIHNPCSATLYTIYKETGSRRWTTVAALLPLFMGFLITFLVAQIWRLIIG